MPIVASMYFVRFILLWVICLLPHAALTQSAETPVEVTPLAGWRVNATTHMAAFQVRLGDGWKTYWRAPGDAGIPPRIIWSETSNVHSATFIWPTPEVFYIAGTRSIGYHDGVTLPLELTVSDPGQDAVIAGTLELGVCEEICIPVSIPFELSLSASQNQRVATITAALVDQPLSAVEASMERPSCAIEPFDDGLRITAEFELPKGQLPETIVIEANDPDIWVSSPALTHEAGKVTAAAELLHLDGGAFALDRSALRFTVFGLGHAVDLHGCRPG